MVQPVYFPPIKITGKEKVGKRNYLLEWTASWSASSPLSKEPEEFETEFSAVTAPVLSSSWLLKRDANDNGLHVELSPLRPFIVLIAASVLRYISTVSSPMDVDGGDVGGGAAVAGVAGKLSGSWFLWSCEADVDSITSARDGKSSSRFASHSRTSLVRGSVIKKGWWRAIRVKGRRSNPPVLLSYFFKILTRPKSRRRKETNIIL